MSNKDLKAKIVYTTYEAAQHDWVGAVPTINGERIVGMQIDPEDESLKDLITEVKKKFGVTEVEVDKRLERYL